MVFRVCFYRRAGANEIGPCPEYKEITAQSKTRAISVAKQLARQWGWRYMAIVPPLDI